MGHRLLVLVGPRRRDRAGPRPEGQHRGAAGPRPRDRPRPRRVAPARRRGRRAGGLTSGQSFSQVGPPALRPSGSTVTIGATPTRRPLTVFQDEYVVV